MTQQARGEGRTKGIGDLAGGPRREEGGYRRELKDCGEILGIQEILESLFSKDILMPK